jgi:hypothetical protein
MNLNVIPPKPSEKKSELIETADALRQKIESQLANIKDETIDNAKKILVIGGASLAVYWLVNALLNDDDKAKKPKIDKESTKVIIQEPAEDSAIFTAIKGAVITFLLALAKEKLMEVLSQLNKPDAEK